MVVGICTCTSTKAPDSRSASASTHVSGTGGAVRAPSASPVGRQAPSSRRRGSWHASLCPRKPRKALSGLSLKRVAALVASRERAAGGARARGLHRRMGWTCIAGSPSSGSFQFSGWAPPIRRTTGSNRQTQSLLLPEARASLRRRHRGRHYGLPLAQQIAALSSGWAGSKGLRVVTASRHEHRATRAQAAERPCANRPILAPSAVVPC